MARPFEFDYNTTIEKGGRVFWKTGSASTSLRDLLKGMKIWEGSFYNTFKSKKNAYLECLKHYNATVNRERGEAFFFGPNAALGIRAMFKLVLDCLRHPFADLPDGRQSHSEVFAEASLPKVVCDRKFPLSLSI